MQTSTLIAAILLISIRGYAQNDTICCNINFSATIKFSADIEYLLIGNNPVIIEDGYERNLHYDVFTNRAAAVIRAASETVPSTSLVAGLIDGSVYTSVLSSCAVVQVTPYIFEPEPAKQVAAPIAPGSKNIQKILLEPQNIYDVAEIKHNIVYQITNIANDDSLTYMKIYIANNTASLFIVDNVIFRYREGKKRTRKNEIYNENWMPVLNQLMPANNEIKAKSGEFIIFVIPLYTVEKGGLIIKVAEKNGSRTADINISAKSMLNITYYK
jgi:hypothetical protein